LCWEQHVGEGGVWCGGVTVTVTVTGQRAKMVETPAPVPFYLPKLPHGITWNRTRISVFRAGD